jgi:type VI protein secretion system component Hcp
VIQGQLNYEKQTDYIIGADTMKMKNWICWFVFLAVLAFVASPAGAAIYLKVEGPVIQGDVTLTGYENQISIASYEQGMGVVITSAGTNGPQASPPQASKIIITKNLDPGSVPLFAICNQGTNIAKMTFTWISSGLGGTVAYYTVYLENILVSSGTQTSSGDRPAETYSLTFRRIRWTSGGSVSGWDYVANAPF